jgi:hypothetical protein
MFLFLSSEPPNEPTVMGPVGNVTLINWTSRLALCKGPNRLGVFLHQLEDVNRSNVKKVVFSSYYEFQTVDIVQEPFDFERYAPASEPFRLKSFDVLNTLFILLSPYENASPLGQECSTN